MCKSAVFLLAWSVAAWTQADVSSIRGSVRDPSGAAIRGVEVRITNLETNFTRSVLSSETGDFEVADLRRGSYRLNASKTGFKTFVGENIILESRQIRRIDVTMEVG